MYKRLFVKRETTTIMYMVVDDAKNINICNLSSTRLLFWLAVANQSLL